MNYQEALNYLQSLPDMETGNRQTRLPNMTLGLMVELLGYLGNPHLKTRTIHVTGSKGKGSTSHFLASILKAANYKTALFTSPHLSSYLERFKIDLNNVEPQLFADSLSKIKPIIDQELKKHDGTMSTFGVLVLMFLQMVHDYKPDLDCQIVEVGIGGRYDATNVFPTKDLAIITPISLEHTEVLGNTITEIANNKAGIIKHGCSAILSMQKDSSAPTAVSRRCYEVDSELIDIGKRYKIKPVSCDFNSQKFQLIPLKPKDAPADFEFEIALKGPHQMTNATTAAIAAIELNKRGFNISVDNIKKGLKDAFIPGRFEIIDSKSNNLKRTFILDGAHNQDSSRAFAQSLKTYYPDKKFIFIVGINNDKNINLIWKELFDLASEVIVTRSANPKAFSTELIKEVVSFYGLANDKIFTTQTTAEALEALKNCDENSLICVCGSLYTVGEIRSLIISD